MLKNNFDKVLLIHYRMYRIMSEFIFRFNFLQVGFLNIILSLEVCKLPLLLVNVTLDTYGKQALFYEVRIKGFYQIRHYRCSNRSAKCL